MLHTLKNQTLELFCLTYNSFLLESRGRVFLYTDSMHAVSRSELRTWQVMPYFRVAYIASTSLPCFSVRCSHVIFLVSFLLSCYLRLGIYNNNNFRTFTYLNRTLAYMAFGFCSDPLCFPSLQSRASVYVYLIYNSTTSALMFHSSTHLIQEPFFPAWPTSVAGHQG